MSDGALLGENRLVTAAEDIRRDRPPRRSATVVAAGHVVALELTTAEARTCFLPEHLRQIQQMGLQRRQATAQQAGGSVDQHTVHDPVECLLLAQSALVCPCATAGTQAWLQD